MPGGCPGGCPGRAGGAAALPALHTWRRWKGGALGGVPTSAPHPRVLGRGSGMEGRDPCGQRAEPGGSGTAPPPLPARLGRMLGGGRAAGSPRSPHPQRCPVSPFSRLPDGFFPMHKAQLFCPEVAAPAAQPVPRHPRHPPAADFPPLGGYFPLSMLRSSPRTRAWRHLQTFPAPGEAAAGRGWRQSPVPGEDNTSRVTDGWGQGPPPVLNT